MCLCRHRCHVVDFCGAPAAAALSCTIDDSDFEPADVRMSSAAHEGRGKTACRWASTVMCIAHACVRVSIGCVWGADAVLLLRCHQLGGIVPALFCIHPGKGSIRRVYAVSGGPSQPSACAAAVAAAHAGGWLGLLLLLLQVSMHIWYTREHKERPLTCPHCMSQPHMYTFSMEPCTYLQFPVGADFWQALKWIFTVGPFALPPSGFGCRWFCLTTRDCVSSHPGSR